MKTKNKILAMLEIVIVLCSVFLVALPGIAADQKQETQKVSASEVTTASEDDFVLGIYGNANEDDIIDMRDYTYTARIICWLEDETTFADANYDGRISVADMTQIGLIVLGRESELTIVDARDRIVTVNKPVERISPLSWPSLQMLKTLNAADKAVSRCEYIKSRLFYGECCDLPLVSEESLDYEMILSLESDLVIQSMDPWHDDVEDTLESLGITTIRFGCGEEMVCIDTTFEEYHLEEIRKLGYILDRREEADEYCDWYSGIINTITSQTEGLSEEDKPRVYLSNWAGYFQDGSDYTRGGDSGWQQKCDIIGARNIAADLSGEYVLIDVEWVIEQNPDVIFQGAATILFKADYDYLAGCYEIDDPTKIIEGREVFMGCPEMAEVTAVENGDVYLYGCCCGCSHIVCLPYQARWLHPDLFEDLDPEEIHQEYLTRFMQLDYDLDEHGIFSYPPIEIDGGLAGIPDKWL